MVKDQKKEQEKINALLSVHEIKGEKGTPSIFTLKIYSVEY